MRQQKSKWNKMGSFFLVCWLGCLSLCLFICLIVLVLDGFSIYCFFFCFCFAQSCVCSLLFVFGLFWGCLTDWLIMLVHHVWLYVSCIAYLATSLLVRLLVCLLLFFDIFCLLVGMCLALGFLNFTIFCWRRRRRVEYKCPPDSNNEGRTNAATFWSVRRAHERWAP